MSVIEISPTDQIVNPVLLAEASGDMGLYDRLRLLRDSLGFLASGEAERPNTILLSVQCAAIGIAAYCADKGLPMPDLTQG